MNRPSDTERSSGSLEQAAKGTVRSVLLLAPQPFYEDRGTPIAVHQVLEALSHSGYEIDVITYPVGREVNIPGVRVFRCPNLFTIRSVPIGLSLQKIVLDLCMLPGIFRRLQNHNYGCIHAVEEAAFPAVFLGRRFGVPVVYDMQSSMAEQMAKFSLFRRRPVQAVLRRCEGWLLANADWVICSTGLAGRIRSINPNAQVHEWSYVGEHRPVAPSEVTDLRLMLQIPEGAPVVVYAGSFEEYQGLPILLTAFPRILRQIPRAVFVLVGGTGVSEAKVHRWTKELGLTSSVRLISRQPRECIHAFLLLADVLVSARAYGGNLPLKIFDYLTAGRPIVATDIPCHRAILNEQIAVLAAPEGSAIANAVVQLLQEPARAAALGAAAREYAVRQCGRGRFFRNVERIYCRVCDRRTRARA